MEYFFFITVGLCYIFPWSVAWARRHHQHQAILGMQIVGLVLIPVLGKLTFIILWGLAMVWALSAVRHPATR